MTQERKKLLIAALLMVVLGGVIYYQFFGGGDAPPAVGARPTPTLRQAPPSNASRAAIAASNEIATEPLPVELLAGKAIPTSGTGRNIFIYPPPPPPPTPTPTPTPIPTPPPPIILSAINPAGVIARTAAFRLTVVGAPIPPDARGFINGREYPTSIVNETQMTVAVPAEAIAAAGTARVEVKSASNAQLYSNVLNLNIAEPPAPPYQYIALYIDKKGVHTAVLKSQTDGKIFNVKQGETINQWRVLAISVQKIDLLDTNINVPHAVRFTGEGG
jgi:hypothetical protein